jgi:hypothetical protein
VHPISLTSINTEHHLYNSREECNEARGNI